MKAERPDVGTKLIVAGNWYLTVAWCDVRDEV
jgi:hypothetical protein